MEVLCIMKYLSYIENNEMRFIFKQSGFKNELNGSFIIKVKFDPEINKDYITVKSNIDQIFSTITNVYSDEKFSINRLVLDYVLYNIQDISYDDLLWSRLPDFEMDKEGKSFIYYANNINYEEILSYVKRNYLNIVDKFDNFRL